MHGEYGTYQICLSTAPSIEPEDGLPLPRQSVEISLTGNSTEETITSSIGLLLVAALWDIEGVPPPCRAGCMKLSFAVRINGPRGNTAVQVRARVLRQLSETDNVARSAQQNSEKNRNGFLPLSVPRSKLLRLAGWLAGCMDGSFVSDAHRVGVMCRNSIQVPNCPNTVQIMIRKTIWDFENHPYQDVGARACVCMPRSPINPVAREERERGEAFPVGPESEFWKDGLSKNTSNSP